MIKNLIFDLGGVLYDLDFPTFGDNLRALRQTPQAPLFEYSRRSQPDVFTDYETGRIDTIGFRQKLRDGYGMEVSDAAIDTAWNSILVGIFPGRIDLLAAWKQHYRLALLSNINPLHLSHIQPECEPLFAQFERCFFSFEMGCRKPELIIFSRILSAMEFEPAETLFVDDSPQHVEAAKSLGIHGIWLENPEHLAAMIDRETQV